LVLLVISSVYAPYHLTADDYRFPDPGVLLSDHNIWNYSLMTRKGQQHTTEGRTIGLSNAPDGAQVVLLSLTPDSAAFLQPVGITSFDCKEHVGEHNDTVEG
jgi:hypothetical protein